MENHILIDNIENIINISPSIFNMLNTTYKSMFAIYGGDVGFWLSDSAKNRTTSDGHLK